MRRNYAIPTAGLLTLTLGACAGDDPMLGTWPVSQTSTFEGESTSWPSTETIDSYVTYTLERSQTTEWFEAYRSMDVLVTYTYRVSYTYAGEVYEYGGTYLDFGRAWEIDKGTYRLVVPERRMDMSCTLDEEAARVSCASTNDGADSDTASMVLARSGG